MRILLNAAIPALSALFLVACGGGSGTPSPTPPTAAPTALSYPTPQMLTKGAAMSALTPAVVGSPTRYVVTPGLPGGLSMDATTGVISGTPTVIAATANYQVTASNSGGQTSSTLSITVNDIAPVLAYPQIGYTLVNGVPISTITPTVTGGAVVTWSIDQAPPAGLSFNATSGVISGTPNAPQNSTNYRVTASNSGGAAAATLSITVNDTAPSIAYPSAFQTLTTGVRIAALTPVVTGSAVVSWTVDRTLPAGLTLDPATGRITGTPTAVSPAGSYVVTGSNTGGADTFTLTLAVQSGVLIELGHTSGISEIQYQGNRAMSLDRSGRLIVWNVQTGAEVLNVSAACGSFCNTTASLAGTKVVAREPGGFVVYSSVDGSLITHIAAPNVSLTRWKLAADGSYVCAYTETELTAWSTTGTLLFSKPGNYLAAVPFAAASEIRVGNGAAGTQVIENIAMPSGNSTLSPAFGGAFHEWFRDGERFLTHAGNTVFVFSRAAVQQDISALPTIEGLAGMGNWFWINPATGPLRLYAVGNSATPAATYPTSTLSQVFASGNTLAWFPYGDPALQVIDLSGATPVASSFVTPTSYNTAFAALSSTEWLFGNSQGVLTGELTNGNPQRYSYGAARSIAGSANRVAIATASGQILYFNAASKDLEGALEFSSSEIQLSTDGSVLAAAANDSAAQYEIDRTLRVYSLPAQSLITEWPASYGIGSTFPFDFEMSDAGDRIGQVLGRFDTSWNATHQVMRLDHSIVWSDTRAIGPGVPSDVPIHLSGSGSLTAFPDRAANQNTGANIFNDATLTGATVGWPVGWIDDSRLLVNQYTPVSGNPHFSGVVIVNAAGAPLATSAFPEIHHLQRVAPNTVYSRELNSIIDVTTGNTVWSSASAFPASTQGAVAGNFVFFASGSTVRAEPL